jgi:hypothetical protein
MCHGQVSPQACFLGQHEDPQQVITRDSEAQIGSIAGIASSESFQEFHCPAGGHQAFHVTKVRLDLKGLGHHLLNLLS